MDKMQKNIQKMPSNVEIFNFSSRVDAVDGATQKLQSLIDVEISNGNSILLLLSGSSSLSLLVNLSAKNFSDKITIGVLDERYSTNSIVNNFSLLTQTDFYKNAKDSGAKFIDTRVTENGSQIELAERFESSLKKWRHDNPTGKIISTQGIGTDGHTSGISPLPNDAGKFEEMFDNKDKWVTSYEYVYNNECPLRVTTTLPFLRMIDESVVFVCGEEKKFAVKKTLKENGDLASIPARIIFQMKKVSIFTDVQF